MTKYDIFGSAASTISHDEISPSAHVHVTSDPSCVHTSCLLQASRPFNDQPRSRIDHDQTVGDMVETLRTFKRHTLNFYSAERFSDAIEMLFNTLLVTYE